MAAREWLPATARSAAIDHKLKAGEPLFRLGDKTLGLCEVLAGRVRLARVDRSGREIVLHVAGPGETLAEASLFSPQYHCDAIANGGIQQDRGVNGGNRPRGQIARIVIRFGRLFVPRMLRSAPPFGGVMRC